ncbi:haloacid dehalogenase [Burkholderia sp. Leaf177]|nr:haloacid dehalogenase [Burkholderia sp. Leaf177]
MPTTHYDSSKTVRSYLASTGIANLMATQGVTEVSINRPHEIWTESVSGWQQHAAPALSLDLCKKLADALAIYNKATPPLSVLAPIKPVRLPDGERGQVMIAPACESGTVSMTIRIPSTVRFSMDDYVRAGTLAGFDDMSPSVLSSRIAARKLPDLLENSFQDAAPIDFVPAGVALAHFELEMLAAKASRNVARLLELAIKHKLNIVTVGGVGSGKTTLMKMLADLVPATTRIGTIEDTHELSLPNHLNHVHMFFSDNLPAKEIVRSTLRMKFDRVFLTELRGDETWDYLTLLNTGTDGGMTSVHANDCASAFSRIATLVKASQVGQTLDWNYILHEVKTTIDLVLFMEKKRLTQIHYDPVEKWKLLRGLA